MPKWILGAGVLGVIAYHLPWHTHAVAAFTNNAFDLAEWVSIHPNSLLENPALWSSMLLRLPLVLFAISIALSAGQLQDERWRWLWRAVALLVVLRLNPPIDFYRHPGEVSENAQQLGKLMLTGLAGVVIVMSGNRWLKQIYLPLQALLWLGIGVASWEGLRRATRTIETLQLDVNYGAGIYGVLALVIGVWFLCFLEWKRGWQ